MRLLHESLQRAGCSCGSDGADDARAQARHARATALPAISINASSPASATNTATNTATREDVAGLPPRHSASAAAVGNCTAWLANTSALLRRGDCSPCRRLRYMQVLVPSSLDPEPPLVAVIGRFGFQRDVSALLTPSICMCASRFCAPPPPRTTQCRREWGQRVAQLMRLGDAWGGLGCHADKSSTQSKNSSSAAPRATTTPEDAATADCAAREPAPRSATKLREREKESEGEVSYATNLMSEGGRLSTRREAEPAGSCVLHHWQENASTAGLPQDAWWEVLHSDCCGSSGSQAHNLADAVVQGEGATSGGVSGRREDEKVECGDGRQQIALQAERVCHHARVFPVLAIRRKLE